MHLDAGANERNYDHTETVAKVKLGAKQKYFFEKQTNTKQSS